MSSTPVGGCPIAARGEAWRTGSVHLIRPTQAQLTDAVLKAFADQFLPKQSEILEPDTSTLKFGATKNGKVPFSFTAEKWIGGFAGNFKTDETKGFTGTYDLRSKEISFTQVP